MAGVPKMQEQFSAECRSNSRPVLWHRSCKETPMALADQQCIPCRGGVPPLARERVDALLRELDSGWALTPTGHLLRTYEFRDFAAAMAFANKVGDIAEDQGHHPDLCVAWGKCGVEIWTHKIDGLTESDFFLAAKADRAFKR